MARITLTVEQDHVVHLARLTDPVGAVAELIWNGLDADADHVDVVVETNELDGVEHVMVRDDGHGMPVEACNAHFQALGGSWKKNSLRTQGKQRALHGKNGRGRLRAFALGDRIRWTSVADSVDGRRRTVIDARRSAMREFVIGASVPTDEPTGTTVEAWGDGAGRLLDPKTTSTLTAEFALYLEAYPGIVVTFRGKRLDPAMAQINAADYRLGETDGVPAPRLRIIEWRKPVTRELALCDAAGMPVEKLKPQINAAGFHFTAYLSWQGFEGHQHDLALVEMDDDSPAARVVEEARERLRGHFRERAEERRREQVWEWQAEGVYPYAGEPADASEVAEREAFDTVATTIAGHIPRPLKARRATLGLLKEVLSSRPDHAHETFTRLFQLSKQEREDLERLLRRTSLAALIRTSTAVTDRLDFLKALELMVFDPDAKPSVRERDQLHRILESETWVFGEEYSLLVSDRSLTEVLLRHLDVLRKPRPRNTAVVRADGRPGRVDLMLSKAGFRRDERHHLVVELKRPSLRLSMTEFSQLVGYAQAVAGDERFQDTRTTWDFWLVGNTMDDAVRSLTTQSHLPPGCAVSGDNYRLWVRTWAEIVEECRQRLQFYRNELEYQSNGEHAVDYLIRKHSEAVPPALAELAAGDTSSAGTAITFPAPRREIGHEA